MRQLKNIMIAATFCSGFAACSSQKSEASSADAVYSCPMHPEVTGKEGDKCPKCGMALTHK